MSRRVGGDNVKCSIISSRISAFSSLKKAGGRTTTGSGTGDNVRNGIVSSRIRSVRTIITGSILSVIRWNDVMGGNCNRKGDDSKRNANVNVIETGSRNFNGNSASENISRIRPINKGIMTGSLKSGISRVIGISIRSIGGSGNCSRAISSERSIGSVCSGGSCVCISSIARSCCNGTGGSTFSIGSRTGSDSDGRNNGRSRIAGYARSSIGSIRNAVRIINRVIAYIA